QSWRPSALGRRRRLARPLGTAGAQHSLRPLPRPMGAAQAHDAVLGADATRRSGAILARKRALAGFLRARKRVRSVSKTLATLKVSAKRHDIITTDAQGMASARQPTHCALRMTPQQ